MKLHAIDTGLFKLDGGAMFGVVPKTIWQKLNPADENNMCTWAMRCLLIEDGKRLILVDTGIGDKQDAKFFSHYYLHDDGSLLKSIGKAGFSAVDVTDVVLTHLHFDHVGGAVRGAADNGKPELTFPNARHWSTPAHWQWAVQPNSREKASFLAENILPIEQSGQLDFIRPGQPSPWPNIDFIFVNGHTEAMLLPRIQYRSQTIVYMADLIPSAWHVPIPYVMGYDVRPLLTMEEKEKILGEAADNQWLLVFEHDAATEAATVARTEKGVRIDRKGKLTDWL